MSVLINVHPIDTALHSPSDSIPSLRIPSFGPPLIDFRYQNRDTWERVSGPPERVSEPWEDVSQHLGTCSGTLGTRTPNPGNVFRVAKTWFRALGKRSRFAITRFRVARN